MAESEQHPFLKSLYSNGADDVPEVKAGIPIASANHYLLLFAIVLPYALSSIFGFLKLDVESITGLLQLKLLSFGILLICLMPYAKTLLQSERFKNAPALRTILWALLYNIFAVVGTNLFINAFFPQWLELTPSFLPTNSWDYLLLPIALAIIVPLEEELVFRGILLGSYERLLSPRNAFIAVSAIFALVHIIPAQVIAILPTCFIITRAVQFSNSIWTGVIIHMVINSLASVAMLLPVPETAEGAVLDSAVLTPEAGTSPMVGILGLCLTATMMWIAYRKWGLAINLKPNNAKEILWTMSLIVVVGFSALALVAIMVNPEL